MTSNEDAEIRKHGYKPLKRRSPTPLYYPLGYEVLPVVHVRARAPYRAWHIPPPRPRRAGVTLEPGPMRRLHPRHWSPKRRRRRPRRRPHRAGGPRAGPSRAPRALPHSSPTTATPRLSAPAAPPSPPPSPPPASPPTLPSFHRDGLPGPKRPQAPPSAPQASLVRVPRVPLVHAPRAPPRARHTRACTHKQKSKKLTAHTPSRRSRTNPPFQAPPPATKDTASQAPPQLRPMAVRVVHKLQHHPLGVARRTAPKAHTRGAVSRARAHPKQVVAQCRAVQPVVPRPRRLGHGDASAASGRGQQSLVVQAATRAPRRPRAPPSSKGGAQAAARRRHGGRRQGWGDCGGEGDSNWRRRRRGGGREGDAGCRLGLGRLRGARRAAGFHRARVAGAYIKYRGRNA